MVEILHNCFTIAINDAMKESGYSSGDEYLMTMDLWMDSKFYEEIENYLKNEIKNKWRGD